MNKPQRRSRIQPPSRAKARGPKPTVGIQAAKQRARIDELKRGVSRNWVELWKNMHESTFAAAVAYSQPVLIALLSKTTPVDLLQLEDGTYQLRAKVDVTPSQVERMLSVISEETATNSPSPGLSETPHD